MTIAISIKVNDGLVLAADSATTVVGQNQQVLNVYNHANKIFNLRKGLPIGAMTWGAGNLGPLSISTLAKDLRRRFTGDDPAHLPWRLDEQSYRLVDVAQRLREFMFDEHYTTAFGAGSNPKPQVGFLVAGYSAGNSLAEEYEITIDGSGVCSGPTLLRPLGDCGWAAWGQPEAVVRLASGFSPAIVEVLKKELKVSDADLPKAVDALKQSLGAPLVFPAMPFQDAIDLAEFFVAASIQWHRFMPGAPTVGGAIEIGAISKHEGFKWVRRKHYYPQEFNP